MAIPSVTAISGLRRLPISSLFYVRQAFSVVFRCGRAHWAPCKVCPGSKPVLRENAESTAYPDESMRYEKLRWTKIVGFQGRDGCCHRLLRDEHGIGRGIRSAESLSRSG